MVRISAHAQRELARIALLSFALNFLWEHLHAPLYAHYQGGLITEWVLFHATLGDAAILVLLAIPFVISSWWRTRPWLIIPIGLVVAIVIELAALHAGRWAYGSAMPLIPYLGVGLSPALQLAATGYIAYLLIL